MRNLITLLLATMLPTGPASAQEAIFTVDAGASTIAYHLEHKFHKVDATSRKAEGKARVLPDKVQVMVRAPIASFDSGNSNRDVHMREATEESKFPWVELKLLGEGGSVPAVGQTASMDRRFRGELNLHGVRRPIEIPVHLAFEADGRVRATSQFNVSLDEHKVERPSLLFIKVDDVIVINVDVTFRR